MFLQKPVIAREKHARFPADAKTRRKILFEKAGISLEDEAALLKAAFDTNVKNLTAEKLEVRVLEDGTVVTVPVPDNQIRQRAVEAAYDMVGAKSNVKGEGDGGGPRLTLVLPNYYSREFLEKEHATIDITPDAEHVDDSSDDGLGLLESRDVRGDGVEGDEEYGDLQPDTVPVVPSSDVTESDRTPACAGV